MDGLGRLRAIAESELELIRGWRNAPEVRANMYMRHEISAEEHAAWWARTRERTDQRYLMYEHDAPLGVVAFNGIDRTNESSGWAFYAAPDAPLGTGSRMEVLALDHAFAELRLHKLYCEVLAFNTAVLKLHRKFGFQLEGVFREQHKVDGRFVDIHRLGLLAHEWAGQRAQLVARVAALSRKAS